MGCIMDSHLILCCLLSASFCKGKYYIQLCPLLSIFAKNYVSDIKLSLCNGTNKLLCEIIIFFSPATLALFCNPHVFSLKHQHGKVLVLLFLAV